MITTNQFILRPLVDSDAQSMSAAVRESVGSVGKWMSWAKPDFSDYDAACWFASCSQSRVSGTAHEFGIFDREGKFVGGCGLNSIQSQHKLCNLGYWVRQSRQREGAAAQATLALRDFAFERLKLCRLEIVVADGNHASMAVARKVGAAYECLAQNRLQLHGQPVAAHVFSLVP